MRCGTNIVTIRVRRCICGVCHGRGGRVCGEPEKRILLRFIDSLMEAESPSEVDDTNSGQRVSECRRVKLCVVAAPPSGGHAHLLLTSRRPLT